MITTGYSSSQTRRLLHSEASGKLKAFLEPCFTETHQIISIPLIKLVGGTEMSKMSEDDAYLPSYDESSFQVSSGRAVLDQLTLVRGQHLRSIVSESIYPVISQRASQGLSKTSLALIPSNLLEGTVTSSMFTPNMYFGWTLTDATEAESASASAGFVQSEETLTEVRLVGPLNTYEFWQQQGILNDLKMLLTERLSTTPLLYSDRSLTGSQSAHSTSNLPSPSTQRTRGFSLFKKKLSSERGSSLTNTALNPKPEPEIQVDVDLEEICLRTESNFGLYETITRPAVVVRVLARC
jgi:hypothetical protein